MAILLAFQSRELDIIGLTTVFGNVLTPLATSNALHLVRARCELAGRKDIPVAEGAHGPLKGGEASAAALIHGHDGLGNTFPAPPEGKPIAASAVDFILDAVTQRPNAITVVALGPLTNVALAVQKDPTFVQKVSQIVVLGGAFFSSGNVNPAAEANVWCDPEAADIVFTCGAEVFVVGINVTTQVVFTDEDLRGLLDNGRFGDYVHKACQFYKAWHSESDGLDGIYVHDPTCMVAAIAPSHFRWREGVVRVETAGVCTGHTLLDLGLKKQAPQSLTTLLGVLFAA
eukprot:SM000083S22753  [mRNA]  locus=s83:304314:306539:+ [translate_table: standard]